VPLSEAGEERDNTLAQQALAEAVLPHDAQGLFQWILEQSQDQQLALLAFCAAGSLDAIQNHENESPADNLARALNLDLRRWWRPTAEGYFKSISKAAILQAVSEAVSPAAAARMDTLKKKDLASEADSALGASGWLPPFLRAAWSGPQSQA
jgi:ParB family chromosome partitioning protein